MLASNNKSQLRNHLKDISVIDRDAKGDPCMVRNNNGLFECRVCFGAFANEKRYREHTKTERHRLLAKRL